MGQSPELAPIAHCDGQYGRIVIICHLYNIDEEDTKENRKKNLLLYTSVGLAPSIQIFNSSYSEVFYFKMNLLEGLDSWSIEIPREAITFNTDVAPVEQWFVKFNMHHGLDMFTTHGTLMDVVREPILQWEIGEKANIMPVIPYVQDLKVTKSPCANDVAIIGLFTNGGPAGIRLGLTRDGFMHRAIKWFDLSSSICSILNYDCNDLALVNVILTNNHLAVLTTLGLFISEDLGFRTDNRLSFYKPNFCGFEMSDYVEAKIWYNIQCLANKEYYEEDYISLTFNKDKTLSQESTCFYSNAPFRDWYSCLSHRTETERKISKRVVSFLVDAQQNTGIALIAQQTEALVWVHKLTDHILHRQRKFPAFMFPDQTFKPFGMFFHPNSHFLYVYGNQVWISEDGGNTFVMLLRLVNETVVKTDTCVYTQAILFVTNQGTIFYTKAGLSRFAGLTDVLANVFALYFDHLGVLSEITLNTTASDRLSVYVMEVDSLLQGDDFGFESTISPQFITEEQMLFFSHLPAGSAAATQPRFYNLHTDKSLLHLYGGTGLISKVFTDGNSPQFISAVLVDVLDRFPLEAPADSPCLINSLKILAPATGTTAYTLELIGLAVGFQATDVEKTVVIPDYSSFLIIQVLSDSTALADATMPSRVPLGKEFETEQWFMYDFGATIDRKWKIVVDICRYTIQQVDDLPVNSIKYLDLGATQHFTFRVTPINTAFPIFHMPLLKIIVGRPDLLEVIPVDYWDNTDSYVVELGIHSEFFEQGKTSIALIVNQASLICEVTTLILTVKSSCSYLKTMHYIVPAAISASDWLSTDQKNKHNASAASSLLKNLPVNYRPPSKLGIAVPLAENFYHADPSKPRMRNYFVSSQMSGKYKQCAGKKNRAECGCTDNMKLSFAVAFSDCKEKALRMKYPVSKLSLNFTVKDADGLKVLSAPFFITIIEVNNRTNWEISGPRETSSVVKIRKYLAKKLNTTLYNPVGLHLSIYGSELFHFRVSTIPGVSFCSLFDEFQIYIDDVPLAFPGGNLINAVTAILIGGIIFLAFMMHVYEIQIGHILKAFRKNKVASKSSVSTRSTTSTETSKK
ncbi:cation channel sperm-associated auxiliary subunit beta [Tiliqua scincoides]|uniref:cation channel sperm-associated auxiliary subunit beta n=1 Tax=Tiliqua scincoides TaxID=71010 RepID=UPI00346257B4